MTLYLYQVPGAGTCSASPASVFSSSASHTQLLRFDGAVLALSSVGVAATAAELLASDSPLAVLLALCRVFGRPFFTC